MARRIEKLSAIGVSKLTKPGYHGDGAGLWLQISATGSKSWIFRYTINGKAREMGLGPLHTVPLAGARTKARECRQLIIDGFNPLDERKQKRLTDALEAAKKMTFDQCAAAYIAAHRAGWKNEKHASQWENTLSTYASPVFGALPVASVDTALVLKVLEPIWATKTETATRLRGRIEQVLDWATVREFRQGENPARWRGHLDKLLGKPSKLQNVEHHPSLPWRDIAAFMPLLKAQEGFAARAVELAILTACRSGEVRGATWAEFDLTAKLWTIPGIRMKASREHVVPLSDEAVTLLEELPRTGEHVFPGIRGGALSDMSLTAVLRRMKRGDITVHGFRSTFRMWAAESSSFPREVAEHALAHKLPDAVEAAYQRGTMIDKRRRLMAAWSKYCHTAPKDATVTPIRGAT